MKNEQEIIYLDKEDLSSLNCTDYHVVARKYGFQYLDDFFDRFNETIFIKEDGVIYTIKQVKFHDIHPDYLKGEQIVDISEYLNDETKPEIQYSEKEVIKLLNDFGIHVSNEILGVEIEMMCELEKWFPNNKKK